MYARLLLATALVGCGDDAGHAGADGALHDASPGEGLRVAWATTPVVPAAIASTTATVTSLVLHVDQLQVIGDAGEPDATTASNFPLSWSLGFAPEPTRFGAAPSALYSKVKLIVDRPPAMGLSIDINGTLDLGGEPELFRIASMQGASLEVSGYGVELAAGEAAEVGVVLDLSAALSSVDFANLPRTNGIYTLDDLQGPAMTMFLGKLGDAFRRP